MNSFDIVAVLATKSNVASTLLLAWTGLNEIRSLVLTTEQHRRLGLSETI